jgi:retron-type reverse transcriptase
VQVSTKLRQIAERARQIRNEGLRTLAHCIDVEFLEAAYRRTRKDGAPGVDGQTAADYKNDLDENLGQLLERFKAGTYRAPAVRRVHIPKGDGSKTRPIGIPTFEDKVLQRAVTMVLEAIYEQEFYGCSYGFRPARSAHQATEALWKATMDVGGGWVIDADIRSFFDTLDHGHLRTFLGRRVRDGVILRAIGKWLNAGVLEGTQLQHPEAGTPQGGVISPLLGNVYPLRRRLRDRLCEREGRPTDLGSLAAPVRPVRADHPPREDPPGGLPWWPAAESGRRRPTDGTGDPGLPWVYLVLGLVPQGTPSRSTEDVEEPLQPSRAVDRGLVPETPA